MVADRDFAETAYDGTGERLPDDDDDPLGNQLEDGDGPMLIV